MTTVLFLIVVACVFVFIKLPYWAYQEHLVANKYRGLVKLAALQPATKQGSGWTITYKEGRATKTFKAPGAKSEPEALAALMV